MASSAGVFAGRRALLVLLPLLLAGWGCRGEQDEAGLRAEGSPVVLICVDTLRSDRLPAYGYRGVETPHLDGLAADSVVFERVYSHYPVTLPAHASLFTGLLPPEHGVRNNRGYFLDEKLETLAERLKGVGYRTAAVVSSMVLRRQTGIGQGFEHYAEPTTSVEDPSLAFAQERGAASVTRAKDWLEGVARGERFFLFLHLFDPHAPYEAPEPFAARYPDPYDAEVAYTDHVVGELLSYLDRRGLFDASLLVFLSDHGEGLGDHGEDEHGVFLYRESLQVPLFVKLPGQRRRGERVTQPVALIDVSPTILDLLGVSHAGLPGRALFAAGGPPAEASIYSESLFGREQYGWSTLRSVIRGDAHYIRAPRPELYDLVADPGETHNLLPGAQVPPGLLEALASVGEGTRSTMEISRDEEERLAALGYVGGPDQDDLPSDLPDPKDHIDEAMEMWSLMDDIGKDDSLAPEIRIQEILADLGIRREHLSRTIAHNMLKAGRPRPALEVLMPFSDSGDPRTQVTLGEIAATLGQTVQARSRFQKALELDPESAEAHRDMGILLLAQTRPSEARRWLERAVGLDERQAEAWNGLGVVRAQAGDRAGAVEAWKRAVDVDPGLSDAWFNLAMTLHGLGERGEAAQALERYVPLVQGAERSRALSLLEQLRRGR